MPWREAPRACPSGHGPGGERVPLSRSLAQHLARNSSPCAGANSYGQGPAPHKGLRTAGGRGRPPHCQEEGVSPSPSNQAQLGTYLVASRHLEDGSWAQGLGVARWRRTLSLREAPGFDPSTRQERRLTPPFIPEPELRQPPRKASSRPRPPPAPALPGQRELLSLRVKATDDLGLGVAQW